MSNSSVMLRKIFGEARPLVEQALDLSDKFKGFRELATANGLDWSQIKALLKAQIQDEREDDGKNRVGRIIEKADFATAYADILGLGTAKMNENNFSSEHGTAPEVCSAMTTSHEATIARHVSCRDGQGVRTVNSPGDLPPHEDGVIVEPASASADVALAASSTNPAPVQGVASEEGADAIALDAPSSYFITDPRTHHAGSTDGGSHEDEVASTANKSSDECRSFEQDPGHVLGSNPVSEVAAIAPASAAIAPVEQSPPFDNAPGAPHSGEWPELPARFDRREKAA